MKTVFIQNLITPYRSRLFNIICSKSKDFGVYYMGLTEADRNWDPNNIDVKICRGAVVSTGSIVLPGITIGEMAHVAAGSVVTKDVPPYTRVAGNPARPIRNLLTNERIG